MSAEVSYLSTSAWATPYSLAERKRFGEPLLAEIHVVYPYGKTSRSVTVPLNRKQLLQVIANAADALRLLDEHEAAS